MCVDSEIPLLLGLIVLGEQAHWDLCLRSSETCEITAKYSLRPLAIEHIVSALRYGLLDVRMFGKRQSTVTFHFSSSRASAATFSRSFLRSSSEFLSLLILERALHASRQSRLVGRIA